MNNCPQKQKLWTGSRIHIPFWSIWGQLNAYDFELVFGGLILIGETFKACVRQGDELYSNFVQSPCEMDTLQRK